MEIGVLGTGYVGLTAGACLAHLGHSVTCTDIDTGKLASLAQGVMPFYEPGLEELLHAGLRQGNLRFTPDAASVVQRPSLLFIAVGTPPAADGSADTRAVFQAADSVASVMQTPKTLVLKSTVPVGTARAVRSAIACKTDVPCTVLSNPEFLREGHCIQDFMHPSRVVIGADDVKGARLLCDVYKAFVPQERILVIDTRSAEMSKYVSNAFLATKISFVNEMANLCEAVGADVELVRRVVGLDPRIGPAHLAPGIGYGGSCLPKDVQAVLHMGREVETPVDLLAAVHRVNALQPVRLFEKVRGFFGGAVAGRRIAIWGLAFKPGTDDMREAPSLALIDLLLRAGASVVAYDPCANPRAMSLLNGRIEYADDQYECVREADALVVVTEWKHFHQPDWSRVRRALKTPVVFDGRNIYDPRSVARLGFTYFAVGRGKELPTAEPRAAAIRRGQRLDETLSPGPLLR